MAQRNDLDWEKVEQHYRAGMLSIRQIGKLCGASQIAIQKKAKVEEWVRDLSAKIRAKARADLVTSPKLPRQVTTQTKRVEREIVDDNAAGEA